MNIKEIARQVAIDTGASTVLHRKGIGLSGYEFSEAELIEFAEALIAEVQKQNEPVAWDGSEEWEQLAYQLCAEEHGEESCNELIWEGYPSEPWGERWLKYEDEAKRMISLVRKFIFPPSVESRIVELESQLAGKWQPIETAPRDGTEILLYSETYGIDVAHFHKGKWRTTAGQCDIEYPTHWLPLPAAPKGEVK